MSGQRTASVGASSDPAPASRPRAGLVIPTFRRPHFLRSALASAVGQTERDIEILVCDNGGDEETSAVVASFADDRIRHLVRATDIGMRANAVDGFRRTRADVVLKLDDDDVLEPDAVARLLAPFETHPATTLTFASFTLIDTHGHPLTTRTVANEHYSGRAVLRPGPYRPFERLVALGTVGLACAAVRREAVDWDDFPADVDTAYDRHIALQAARDGAQAWFVGGRLARYRVHDRSDTVLRTADQCLGSLRAMERALASDRYTEPDFLRERTQVSAVRAARELVREGRPAEARAVVHRAARRAPGVDLARLYGLAWLPGSVSRPILRRRAVPAEHRGGVVGVGVDARPQPRPA